MTVAEARDAMSALVVSLWNTAAPGAILLYDNQRDQHPPKNASLWGRLHIKHDDRDRVTLGSGASALFRSVGALYVQVFVPPGSGTAVIEGVASALVAGLQDADVPGIRLYRVRSNDVGPDGTFYQMNVELNFQYDTDGSI